MRCKQRLHALAKEFMLEERQPGRTDPAIRSATACRTYRVPRSGLVQCPLFCAWGKVRPMRNVLLTILVTFGLATAVSAQTAPAPNLELRLRPGALVDGVPDSFTFEIVNVSKHDVRMPEPMVDCADSYSGFIFIRFQFKPLHPDVKPGMGFGCASDKKKWPSILERARDWRLLRPGESDSQALPQDKLHYQNREPGTYEFWADYTPPAVGLEDQKALRKAGIDFPTVQLSTPHLAFTRQQ
jgi:hypothetical protein